MSYPLSPKTQKMVDERNEVHRRKVARRKTFKPKKKVCQLLTFNEVYGNPDGSYPIDNGPFG